MVSVRRHSLSLMLYSLSGVKANASGQSGTQTRTDKDKGEGRGKTGSLTVEFNILTGVICSPTNPQHICT